MEGIEIRHSDAGLLPEGCTLVMGGGLAGLSAAHALSRARMPALLVEADTVVGGLSRTVRMGEFLFDLGGHRFFTRNAEVEGIVRRLLEGELAHVERSSKIFMRETFFDYPLRPANAILGLGMGTILRAVADYGFERVRCTLGLRGTPVSLEDWVVANFGRTLFNLYFKEYSEKVWGIGCDRISESWVAERIRGLSLWEAVKCAFVRASGREIPTLADSFLYPEEGIGRLAERFRDEIAEVNPVRTRTRVVKLRHDGRRIRSILLDNCNHSYEVEPASCISTIPLTQVVEALDPAPPLPVLDAARALGYRDLVVVALALDRECVTNLSWVYVPEGKYPFGRLHEPRCWSAKMAPAGKTLVVVEYFCFVGDDVWNASDEGLSETSARGLVDLGFIVGHEVIETMVVRVPRAYPLFDVGYEKRTAEVLAYLDGFDNLRLAGRSGMFEYQNMDHAIASGMAAARTIIGGAPCA
jgi:protoporphyrinogen oxidase